MMLLPDEKITTYAVEKIRAAPALTGNARLAIAEATM